MYRLDDVTPYRRRLYLGFVTGGIAVWLFIWSVHLPTDWAIPILLTIVGLTACTVTWTLEYGLKVYRLHVTEIWEVESRTPEVRQLELLRSMPADRLKVVREHLPDLAVLADYRPTGRVEVHVMKPDPHNAYLPVSAGFTVGQIMEFLDLPSRTYEFLPTIGNGAETLERQRHQRITAYLIQSGIATPAYGPNPARWAEGWDAERAHNHFGRVLPDDYEWGRVEDEEPIPAPPQFVPQQVAA